MKRYWFGAIVICVVIALGVFKFTFLALHHKHYDKLSVSIQNNSAPGESILREIVSSYSGDEDISNNSTKIHEALVASHINQNLIGIWHKGVGLYTDKKLYQNIIYRNVFDKNNIKISVGKTNGKSIVLIRKKVIMRSANDNIEFEFLWIERMD